MNRMMSIKRLVCSLAAVCAPQVWAQVAVTDPPPEHHFGQIPLGATYAAQYFSLFNQTSEAVLVGQPRIDGQMAVCMAIGCPVVAPDDFVIGGSDGCTGRTLAPGTGCSVLVGFVPRQPGSRSARLVFPVQGVGDVSRVMSGTGVSQPFDCVMDWAQRTLPDVLAQPTPTFVAGPYHARCYQGGVLCVGADVAFPTVAPASVVVYRGGKLDPIGSLAQWAAQATQAPPSTLRCDQSAAAQ